MDALFLPDLETEPSPSAVLAAFKTEAAWFDARLKAGLSRLDYHGCPWCTPEEPGCSECDPVAREESRGAFRRGF